MRFGLCTQQMFTQLTYYHSAVLFTLLEAEDDFVFFLVTDLSRSKTCPR